MLCGLQKRVPRGSLLITLAKLLVLASLCFLVYHGVENSTTFSALPGRAVQPCLPSPRGKISPNQDAKSILPLWSCFVLVLGPSELKASSTVSEDQEKGRWKVLWSLRWVSLSLPPCQRQCLKCCVGMAQRAQVERAAHVHRWSRRSGGSKCQTWEPVVRWSGLRWGAHSPGTEGSKSTPRNSGFPFVMSLTGNLEGKRRAKRMVLTSSNLDDCSDLGDPALPDSLSVVLTGHLASAGPQQAPSHSFLDSPERLWLAGGTMQHLCYSLSLRFLLTALPLASPWATFLCACFLCLSLFLPLPPSPSLSHLSFISLIPQTFLSFYHQTGPEQI